MHPTEMEVTFKSSKGKAHTIIVPVSLGKQVQDDIRRALEIHDKYPDLIPAEQAFPEAYDPVKGPAMALRGLRYREELTQKELAKRVGIRQHHLSEMENGKRPIGKAMARKLAAELNGDWRVLL